MAETLRDQCKPCPWRDRAYMEADWPEVVEAAAAGETFVCHTRCGPCPGPVIAGVAPRGR